MNTPEFREQVCEGGRICKTRGWDFADVFKWQFRLSRNANPPCAEWKNAKLGGWYLHHCADLPSHELCLATGKKVGILLGVAVDADGQLLQGKTRLKGTRDMASLEQAIEGMAGRFLVVLNCFDNERVYFDPSGGLSAVFSSFDNAVASSVHVLIDRDVEENDTITSDKVLAREDQFLLGETCDRHCHRIRANHYLDLSDFSLVRHWPREGDGFDEEGVTRASLVDSISNRLEAVMNALSGGYRAALPVSGGADSRILLAACRTCLGNISHFYMHDIRQVTLFDRLAGTRLARHLGVPYLVIDRKAPGFLAMSDDEVADLRGKMAFRTSLSFDGIDAATVRAVSLAPECDLVLRGNMAEMTRANKWNRRVARSVVSAEDGLVFLTSRTTEELTERWSAERYQMKLEQYQAWIDSLPLPARHRIPDLAHIEVFAPAAPNNVYYAFDRNFYINPYNDRLILHNTARFHPIARMKRRLVNGIIHACMPELVDFPYLAHFKQLFRAAKAQGINLSSEL